MESWDIPLGVAVELAMHNYYGQYRELIITDEEVCYVCKLNHIFLSLKLQLQ